MITDPAVANQISDLIVERAGRLEESLVLVKDGAPADEFEAYLEAAGKVMAEMLLEIMNPLYEQHPSLKPPQLDS